MDFDFPDLSGLFSGLSDLFSGSGSEAGSGLSDIFDSGSDLPDMTDDFIEDASVLGAASDRSRRRRSSRGGKYRRRRGPSTVGIVFGCACIVAAITVIGLFIRAQNIEETRVIVKSVAIKAKKGDLLSGLSGARDVWGNEIKIVREEASDGTKVSYTAISPGGDDEFGTDDDLSATKVNLNVSKIAGKAAVKGVKGTAKSIKEFGVGLFEGVMGGDKKE
ncbi:hypothetical protein ACFL2R_00925 [Patescibacteria group bacterium]